MPLEAGEGDKENPVLIRYFCFCWHAVKIKQKLREMAASPAKLLDKACSHGGDSPENLKILYLNINNANMIYEKISFTDVRQLVEKIFESGGTNGKLNLTPDSIHEFAELLGIRLKWRPILNWTKNFEDNTYNYTSQDFLEIAFAKTKPSNRQTIIITDECFKDKMAFSILNFKDMVEFMNLVYPQLFNMQFPQPSDFIFIQPDIDLITMIHHEGVRTKYCRT